MQVLPHIQVLSPEQIQQVHSASLQILATVGMRIDSPRARRILSHIDGVTFKDEQHALFQPERVEWAIQAAPRVIPIYNRLGSLVFRLGEDRTRFGIGVTNLYYQNPASGDVELFTRRHMRLSAGLGQSLAAYDVVSTIGIVRDTPASQADLYATLELLAHTTKPLVLLISDLRQCRPCLDLLESLAGSLASRPYAILYVNPVTPLVLNDETAEKMLDAGERGLPVIISNYGMVGMSTPITPAGTLALLTAELLGCLVVCQAARPGAAVILGSLPAYFDMKTMVDFYDPRTMLLNLACAEMMAHYQLPHAGTSGSGNGWGGDLLASGALWMNHLTSCLGKVGLAPFVGGSLASKVFSPEMAVYAAEVIQQARDFSAGFSLDSDSLGLDEIAAAGPGGYFVDSERTYRLFRTAYHTSRIFPRWGLEKWSDEGRPKAEKYLREHTLHLLNTLQTPDDGEELLSKGVSYIEQNFPV